MPVIMAQYTVSTSTAPIFTIPPGSFNCTFYAATSGVFIGMATAVTNVNGYQVPTTATRFEGYLSTRGGQVYGFATAGTTINVIMVTDQ